MILEKENAVAENRKLMGATDPEKAEEGPKEKIWNFNIKFSSWIRQYREC